MKKLLLLLLLCSLAACVSAVKVESGERAVGERLVFNIDGAWNQINAPGIGPAQIWTMEGLPVDQLLVYSGIKDGEAISASGVNVAGNSSDSARKSFNFRSSMQPDEIVSLFEGMLTRDGSTFKLDKLEPAKFGGGRGFRFDYSVTRKIDSVQLSGIGYATVDKGQLFAIVYLAPRLTFFPRHKAKVEQIAQSAKLKG
jgi:hypothetical protein